MAILDFQAYILPSGQFDSAGYLRTLYPNIDFSGFPQEQLDMLAMLGESYDVPSYAIPDITDEEISLISNLVASRVNPEFDAQKEDITKNFEDTKRFTTQDLPLAVKNYVGERTTQLQQTGLNFEQAVEQAQLEARQGGKLFSTFRTRAEDRLAQEKAGIVESINRQYGQGVRNQFRDYERRYGTKAAETLLSNLKKHNPDMFVPTDLLSGGEQGVVTYEYGKNQEAVEKARLAAQDALQRQEVIERRRQETEAATRREMAGAVTIPN